MRLVIVALEVLTLLTGTALAADIPIARSYGDKANCDALSEDQYGLGTITDKGLLLTPQALFLPGTICVRNDLTGAPRRSHGAVEIHVTCYDYAPNAHDTIRGTLSFTEASDHRSASIVELADFNHLNSKTQLPGFVMLSKKTLPACKAPARK